MQSKNIKINKTPENPEGTEIEIVHAQNELEEQMLCYMVTLYAQKAKQDGNLKIDVADGFSMKYNPDGSLTMMSAPNAGSSQYYTPAQPVGVFLVRPINKGFEIGYAPVSEEALQNARDAAAREQARKPAE